MCSLPLRNHHHIRGLSARLKLISFNFCLSPAKFGELMQLGQNEFFHDLVGKWFTLLRNNKNSTVVNGLEFLAGLAIAARSGKFDERVTCASWYMRSDKIRAFCLWSSLFSLPSPPSLSKSLSIFLYIGLRIPYLYLFLSFPLVKAKASNLPHDTVLIFRSVASLTFLILTKRVQ